VYSADDGIKSRTEARKMYDAKKVDHAISKQAVDWISHD